MKRGIILWGAILAGPVIWLLSFGARLSLGPWACASKSKPMLYVISAAALLLCAASTGVSWSEWRQLGREYPDQEAGVVPRNRVLAIAGVVLGIGSCILVLAQAVVEIGLGACQ